MFKKSSYASTVLFLFVSCLRVSASNWTDVQRLLASPPEGGDAFGQRVALSGNTAIVASLFNDDAAPNDSGALYVLERSEAGSWSQKGVLYAPDAAAGDHFGSAIDIDGDILAATSREDGPSGSLYIFQRTGIGSTGFSLVKKVTAGSPPSTPFGESVSISGDRIAVGTRLGDQVYIYERNLGGPDNWGYRVTISDPLGSGRRFGSAVSLDRDLLAIGAGEDDGGATDSGAVQIHSRNQGGPDAWGLVKVIRASDPDPGDNFGLGVVLEGSTLVVSAQFDDELGLNAGAAYVFEENAGGLGQWGQVKKLQPHDGASLDEFGSLAISGDSILVGSVAATAGPRSGSGYIFERNFGGEDFWGQASQLWPGALQAGDRLGWAVALDGEFAILGAPGATDGSGETGAVFLFEQVLFCDGFESGTTARWN